MAHTSAELPATGAAALQVGDFSNGLCYIMKTAVAESNPETEPVTHVVLYPQRHG